MLLTSTTNLFNFKADVPIRGPQIPMAAPTCHTNASLSAAFISSRLDYCNSLLFGISDSLLRSLQAVQNAAARLLLVLDVVSTSRPSSSNVIGCQYDSVLDLTWQFWSTRR